MSQQLSISATQRSVVGHGIKALRRSGQVPGIVYGHNITPKAIQLDAQELATVLRRAKKNSLINLSIDGVTKMVLTREIQREPIKHDVRHIDFYEVSMSEKLFAEVRINPVGEPADIKSGMGVLLQEMNAVRIRCLPQDLIDQIEVNIANMKVDDAVLVRDLKVPAGVEIMNDADDEVLRISRYTDAKVEELTAVSAEVEVIEKGKKEVEGAAEAPKKK
jgi:large subunit ribosomal protein L25